MILFFFIVPSSHHEGIVVSSLGLLGVAVDNSGDLFVENSIVDIGLFGMEIFVEGSSDNTIIIDLDSKFGGDGGEVGIVFVVSALMGEDEEVAPCFDILDEAVDFVGGEWVFGGG